jgi:hypothetical protein
MAGDSSMILVSRLRLAGWPSNEVNKMRLDVVLAASPIPDYVPELDRSNSYDAGRVRWMYDRLMAGEDLDPINIDWKWWGMAPTELTISDGNHRWVAHVLAGKEVIPASYSGPTDCLRWLEGDNVPCPEYFG